MKSLLSKIAAVAAIAMVPLLAAPAASADTYVPQPVGVVSNAVLTPGAHTTFSVPAGLFDAYEPVTVRLFGSGTANIIATLAATGNEPAKKTVEATVDATADGGLAPVTITFGDDAVGVQTITATSASNPVGVSATVTITAPEEAAKAPAKELVRTGGELNLFGLWVGGGFLILGVIAVVYTVKGRRKGSAV